MPMGYAYRAIMSSGEFSRWYIVGERPADHGFENGVRYPREIVKLVPAGEELFKAAEDWKQGGWAEVPRIKDQIQERIATAQFVGNWILSRIITQRVTANALDLPDGRTIWKTSEGFVVSGPVYPTFEEAHHSAKKET